MKAFGYFLRVRVAQCLAYPGPIPAAGPEGENGVDPSQPVGEAQETRGQRLGRFLEIDKKEKISEFRQGRVIRQGNRI